MSHCHVKKTAGSNSRWVVIVVLRPRRGNAYPRGPKLCRRARGQRSAERWEDIAAEQPGLDLLVCAEPRKIHGRCGVRSEWHCTCDQAAVITPVEPNPRAALTDLILQVGSLIKLFIVVNAERRTALSYRHSQPSNLRREETCIHTGKHK